MIQTFKISKLIQISKQYSNDYSISDIEIHNIQASDSNYEPMGFYKNS